MLSHRNGPMRNCARTFFISRMMNSKWISRMLSDGSLITVAHKCFSVLRNFSHHTPTRLLHYSLAAQSQKSIHYQLERSAPLHNILHRHTKSSFTQHSSLSRHNFSPPIFIEFSAFQHQSLHLHLENSPREGEALSKKSKCFVSHGITYGDELTFNDVAVSNCNWIKGRSVWERKR